MFLPLTMPALRDRRRWSDLTNRIRTGSGRAFFRSIALQPLGPGGDIIPVFRPGDDLLIEIELESRGELKDSMSPLLSTMEGVSAG